MKKRTPVSKIMTENPISVNVTNTLPDVVKIFKERSLHHIPVVSGEKLIGIISKTDIERVSYVSGAQDDKAKIAVYNMLSIPQVMTEQLETVQVDTHLREAAELFARGTFHALPVLDGDKLVGIVTTTDLINYMLEKF